jgi:serine/threonine protein kinase
MGLCSSSPDPASPLKLLNIDKYHSQCPFAPGLYEKVRLLGEGEYATVFEAIDTRKKASNVVSCKVAVKVINLSNLDDDEISQIEREIIIHRKMDHPNVIAVRSLYAHDGFLYLIEDEAFGGDLFDFIASHNPSCNRQDDVAAVHLLKTLLGVVKYLHDRNVAHRDLKPENILLRDARDVTSLLVGDFGHCALLEGGGCDWSHVPAGFARKDSISVKGKASGLIRPNTMQTQVGSPEYMSPEQATVQYPVLAPRAGTGHGQSDVDTTQTALVDEWAVGVIAYVFLTGDYPFGGKSSGGNAVALARSIVKDKVEWPTGEGEFDNPDIKKIVEQLLEKDPRKRLSAEAALKTSILKDIAEKPRISVNDEEYTPASPMNGGQKPQEPMVVLSPRKRAATVDEHIINREKSSKSILHVGVENWDQTGMPSSPRRTNTDDIILDVKAAERGSTSSAGTPKNSAVLFKANAGIGFMR